MRVALLAESFLPHMNGVTGSVLHTLRHLEREGHEALVIAPGSGRIDADLHGAHTQLLRSVPLPSYPAVRVALVPAAQLTTTLRRFQPDVIHLASPFVLGWQGLAAADALRVPTVAVYQTDVIAYTAKYGVPGATAAVSAHVSRLHRRATLTLAPSSSAERQLEALGVDRVRRWGRGVDTESFAPRWRSETWRHRVAGDKRIIGYLGRLAPEKQVDDLRALADLPGTQLVIVGDGPSRATLEKALPHALFTGHLSGDELSTALASFDVFVHTGESETFGQTIQEALASGVPVVATGVGGPVDLVRSSVDGWLYRPGDLAEMRARVADLAGDDGKRHAFAEAAHRSVQTRTWDAVCGQLVSHYEDARLLRPLDDALLARAATRPASPACEPSAPRWRRYVALGDSLTEGLCDTSRVAHGEFRGWADRLAELLSHVGAGNEPLRYANLAVRSRRVRDVLSEQLPRALRMRPDLVSILIGGNDLVAFAVDPVAVAVDLEKAVRMLRDEGIDVLLVTPFLPRRREAKFLARRFAVFASELRRIAAQTGAILLDMEAAPGIGEVDLWADDRVHLRSRGHRFLAYRAAEALGVPDAEALGDLDAVLHEDQDPVLRGTWFGRDVLPWVLRRLQGRTAGDGRVAKHDDWVLIGGRDGQAAPARVQ